MLKHLLIMLLKLQVLSRRKTQVLQSGLERVVKHRRGSAHQNLRLSSGLLREVLCDHVSIHKTN